MSRALFLLPVPDSQALFWPLLRPQPHSLRAPGVPAPPSPDGSAVPRPIPFLGLVFQGVASPSSSPHLFCQFQISDFHFLVFIRISALPLDRPASLAAPAHNTRSWPLPQPGL